LIIAGFVLIGSDGLRRMNAGSEAVATVGSHKITQAEWDAAHRMQVDRLRSQSPNLDTKMLDSPEARYVTLERLVHERVVDEAVQSSHLNTSDARLARELQQSPVIAAMRKPDGSLDTERYRQLAASQGLTPAGFEARVRGQLSAHQVEAGFTETAFSSAALSAVSLNAFFERREVQVSPFNSSDYAGKVNPSDAEIEAYYKAHLTEFQAPESANIEYVVLDLDTIKKTIVLNDADVKKYYDENAAQFNSKEERRASHILINAPKTMPEEERKKARERAQALLDAVRKAPDSFADVARKNSQDGGSAPKGGDLDFFVRSAMVKPFGDAAFSLKKGEISDVVESEFGFHIIKLTDIKGRSFEELRPSIEADIKNQQAQRKFAEVAEAFANSVDEQADSLKPVAERLKLDIKVASNLQRLPVPGATGVLANPKFLAAVFSTDSLEKKRNTEAVEVAPNQLAAAHITQYTAASTRPLEQVRAEVKGKLVTSKAAELAKKEGADKLAAWKAAAPATMPAAVVVSREGAPTVAPAVLNAVLHADTSTLPAWLGVDLGTQGYAVVRVNKVLPRTPPEQARAEQERKQYAQWVASAESKAYYQLLSQRFKVAIKVPRPTSGTFALQGGAQ
jgi:peptidyl-prolyl cis-trans isomerase D